MMISINIDGRTVQTDAGSTVLRAASAAGIRIPTLCYLKDYNEIGACRMCVVEVEGARGLQASCVLPVSEGMVVRTDTELVRKARKAVLELLVSNHPLDCLTCEKNGDCRLQDYCYEYEVKESPYTGRRSEALPDDSNQFWVRDNSKCILCRRCVAVCAALQCSDAIGLAGRGFETRVAVPGEGLLAASRCVSCGTCIANCPTGALMPKLPQKARTWERTKTRTICPYCGVGCELFLVTKGNRILEALPSNGPANNGMLCVKGRFGYDYVAHTDRLTVPLIRKNGELQEASWDEALDAVAKGFKAIAAAHGPDAVAGLSSARCTNEENYLFQKLLRAGIGTNSVDHCARLCHASTVSGLAATLGSGAMTNSINEVLQSDLIFVTGSNTTETHPVIGSKIRQAVQRGARLIVAEPREIELVEQADLFLKIRPGSNVALFNAMMQVIIAEGLQNTAFIDDRTENYAELAELVRDWTPEVAAPVCGVEPELIRQAARLYAQAERASIYYAMGVTQHSTGTDGVMSVANLAMLCGQIGREGTGVNPLRGQNNVQGACDMGALPGDYPGYQKVSDPAVRQKFEAAWGQTLSERPGLTLTEMLPQAGSGQLKALFVMGENPMISDPDLTHVEQSLRKLELLVVQDIFLTETAALADIVLPAASAVEKDGTFTNTERRVQRLRKAVNSPGKAWPDWQILSGLLQRFGLPADYKSPSNIMDEIARVTLVYGGINYARIEHRGLQWPCRDAADPGTKYLHSERFSRGLGKFMPAAYRDSNELPDSKYPLLLTTGRILYQYHTMTMTGRVPGLMKISGTSYIEIHPDDARAAGIADGDRVEVQSRRGRLQARARVTAKLSPGVVFMPFHFGDGAANLLTNPALDPTAKIPELKVCAVQVRVAGGRQAAAGGEVTAGVDNKVGGSR